MRFFSIKKIPANAWLPLILVALTHLAVYYIPMTLNTGRLHYDLTTALDRAVPFLPVSAVPYLLAFPYWIFGFLYAATLGNRHFFRVFAAVELTHLSAFCIYLLFPTTLSWPQTSADTWFGWLAAFIYSMDRPTNLLPSMHCYVSWILWLSVRRQPEVPRNYRRFCLFSSALICLSTQTLKQHYLADLLAGIALAELFFYAAGRGKIPEKLQALFSKFPPFLHAKFRKN